MYGLFRVLLMNNAYPDSQEIYNFVYALVMDNLTRLMPNEHVSMKRLVATNVALTLKSKMKMRKRERVRK